MPLINHVSEEEIAASGVLDRLEEAANKSLASVQLMISDGDPICGGVKFDTLTSLRATEQSLREILAWVEVERQKVQ